MLTTGIENILDHLRSIANFSSSKLDIMSSPPDAVAGRKRPAEAETTAQRVDRRKRRRRIIRPEEGSLFDIMHEHAGKMLYLIPIHWTDLHARLLGADFVPLETMTKPVPDHSPTSPPRTTSPPRPSQVATRLSRDLTCLLASGICSPQFAKLNAIKGILSTLYPTTLSRPKTLARLDLHFGGRVARNAVHIPVLWRHPEATTSFDSATTRPASSFDNKAPSSTARSTASSAWSSQPSPNQPILAYIDRAHLASMRQNLFRIVKGPLDCNKDNDVVVSLQRLRSKNLVPADVDRDPHFIGILLAMAQAHFFENTPRSSQGERRSRIPPQFEDVKVQLLTHSDDTSEFIVYTAIVSAHFLRRFAEPTKVSGTEQERSIKIEYQKVPIWPVLGLKERLGKALGRDIAGNYFDEEIDSEEEFMETWETQEERQLRLGTLKRSRTERERDVLGEVLNQSFTTENEDEDDEVALLSPRSKRRCANPVLAVGEVC